MFQKIFKKVIHPTKHLIKINKSITKRNITFTLQKVEFSDMQTRLYIKIKNHRKGAVYFYDYNTKAYQENKSFGSLPVHGTGFKPIETDIKPETEECGVVILDALDENKPVKFEFDVVLKHYDEVKNFVFTIRP